MVRNLVKRFNGSDLLINGMGPWCPQYAHIYNNKDFLVLTADEVAKYEFSRPIFPSIFLVLAGVFMALDVAWILMVWTAATVGTPTQPSGRDKYLR